MEFFATLLEPIKDTPNHIRLGKGAIVPIHLATMPMLKALIKKLEENPQSMLITEAGKKFLYEFEGYKGQDESYYRP